LPDGSGERLAGGWLACADARAALGAHGNHRRLHRVDGVGEARSLPPGSTISWVQPVSWNSSAISARMSQSPSND
jgi:hypothetical protein